MSLRFGNGESCFVIVVGIAEAVVPVVLQLLGYSGFLGAAQRQIMQMTLHKGSQTRRLN